MKIRVTLMTGWEWAKKAALRTVGKKPIDPQPSKEWKLMALISEHSPIKLVQYWVDIDDLRQWVGVHLIRHQFIYPFICSQRSDRQANSDEVADYVLSKIKEDIVNDPSFDKSQWRDYRLQGDGNDHSFVINAQSFINISRKRLCHAASAETRSVWMLVADAIAEVDPELRAAMVPNCIYRGFCVEKECCGYVLTKDYQNKLSEYRNLIPSPESRTKHKK